jgi:hypothetical protein
VLRTTRDGPERLSDALVNLAAAVNGHDGNNPDIVFDREDDSPATHTGFSQSAFGRERARKAGIMRRFGDPVQTLKHSFPRIPADPIQILDGSAG